MDNNNYNVDNKKDVLPETTNIENLNFFNTLYFDLTNIITCITVNLKYMFWIMVLIILLQFTNISYLGKTFEKLCNNQTNKTIHKSQTIMKGGRNLESESETHILGPLLKGGGGGTEAMNVTNELKQNEKRLSFFQNLKQNLGKGGKYGGKYGVAGPVFGNISKIFSAVYYLFFVLFIILLIAGFMTGHVLLFLVITYVVVRFMVRKFTSL